MFRLRVFLKLNARITNNSSIKMEECPICFEPMKNAYILHNCKHAICNTCAKQCKSRSTESCLSIKSTFEIHNKNGNPIKCPLCRTIELQLTVDEFKKYDPDRYNEWIQLELHCDEFGCSFYYQEIKEKSWMPPKYNRIPKRVTWKVRPIKHKNKR